MKNMTRIRIELTNELFKVKERISEAWDISQRQKLTQEEQDEIGNCLCQLDEAIGALEMEIEKKPKKEE